MVIFPGGTGVSGLEVYPWEAADGCHGGSPHLHTACTEAYVVVGGTGELQTLTAHGYSATPLQVGTVAWFSPGTVHRAVNTGDLRVVVVMQNAGLPEAGDAVLTFPPDVLDDPAAYRQAAATPPGSATHAANAEAARRRRDLAVEGFLRLRARTQAGDSTAMDELYLQAVALVQDRASGWREVIESGPGAALRQTMEHLDGLATGLSQHLYAAAMRVEQPPAPHDRAFGMCGRLDTYQLVD